MKEYIVLFREPDGRTEPHSESAIAEHQNNWKRWMIKMQQEEKLISGKPLTLDGMVIYKNDNAFHISEGPYQKINNEIVGGYLLIRATDLQEATSLIRTCPIFEFDGFAEIREVM